MAGDGSLDLQGFAQQADATLSQADPVSATWYTVLDTVLNARITSIFARITWAVTQPTPLKVRVTIDGISIVFQKFNPVSAAIHLTAVAPAAAKSAQEMPTTFTTGVSFTPFLIPFMLEGRSVKVEVRITWAVTQPTPLECTVKYAKR